MLTYQYACQYHTHEVWYADAVEKQGSKQDDNQHDKEYPSGVGDGKQMGDVFDKLHGRL